MFVRPAHRNDAAAIADIYNHYVRDTHITFETEPVPVAGIAARIDRVCASDLPWLVAESDGALLGYAYACPWKERYAYRHSVESTIYLDPRYIGRGLGRTLYAALLEALGNGSVHVVIGGISLPNAASVALHESLGFEAIGAFREVGYKFDRWIDVGYWQLTLRP